MYLYPNASDNYIIIPHSAIAELGNIGKRPLRQSVCLSVCPRAFLHDGWMDFLHIRYHDQIPSAAVTHNIFFVSIPNLSNYSHFLINFVSVLWYLREEWVNFIHICFSNQVPRVADECKVAFGSMPNWSNFASVFINVVSVVMMWRRKGLFSSYLVQYSTIIRNWWM